ncbi:hypothetical protein [Mesorhizobium sp. 1M-11]|uniref:hypothetical protein n=1 Tax=Mesorhizobium sp. 1M-11 TaxID=1529006 RepID=UPI0006C75615|nr:hypothetical protein [Mesorhizobium sp. 1M-11]
MDNTLEKNLAAALEEDMAAYDAGKPAPAPTVAGLYVSADEHFRALAWNKAGLAALKDRCARDVAELLEDRRLEEQRHLERLAKIDAEIAVMHDYERKESEMWERYIAASRSAAMELLA